MGAYNSTQHSTTAISPHMMLTVHEKALPFTVFYPQYEGKKTLPQVYVRDLIRSQQELNDLWRQKSFMIREVHQEGRFCSCKGNLLNNFAFFRRDDFKSFEFENSMAFVFGLMRIDLSFFRHS